MTTEAADEILIGVSDLIEAKRIKSILEDKGVLLRLYNNPQTCTTGSCKPTVEVYALKKDLEVISEFFQKQKDRSFEGLSFDPSLANEVFDPSLEKARCPACGTEFSTQCKECPDCGLVFIAEA